jgi:hypothetical protein
MRGTGGVGYVILCLGITVPAAAWAERQHGGSTLRAGTTVGLTEVGDRTVSTLGGSVAVGWQGGPFAVELEYASQVMLEYTGDDNRDRGELDRVGLALRAVPFELGAAGSSRWRFHGELGVGRQLGVWDTGARFRRADVAAGVGWSLEHRYRRRPGGLPIDRLGWHFGWTLSAARGEAEEAAGVAYGPCKRCPPPPMPAVADTDLGLAVASSLSVGF